MSRGFAAAGVALAAVVGIATSYVTLQPELKRLKDEREGTSFTEQHVQQDDNAISKAIISDLKEAGSQLEPKGKKGAAWGLRQMLFGKTPNQSPNKEADVKAVSSEEKKQVVVEEQEGQRAKAAVVMEVPKKAG